jgi:methylated-DNA-protein-cysteine methyltransferase-like protein
MTGDREPAASLYQRVTRVVKLIPAGMVMSYGGVARQCGQPGLARAVGYALHNLPAGTRVPWWRVINSQGRISIGSPEAAREQKARLMAEGVAVDDELRLDLRHYDAEEIVFRKLGAGSKAGRRKSTVDSRKSKVER